MLRWRAFPGPFREIEVEPAGDMKQTFQDIIQRLHAFWSAQGCLLWQPYSEKVGAGTMNPATVLGVLGEGEWKVAYIEPSYRPDDGRFGENPNRMQMHTQYQVVLKPDPGIRRSSTSRAWRRSASPATATTSASWRTTGNRRRWGPGG
jgi:hypothetical protein